VPERRRFAVLVSRQGNGEQSDAVIKKVAAALGVELLVFVANAPSDYPSVFAAMRAQGAEALVIGATPQFQQDGKLLAGLALEAKLPTVCEWAQMAAEGCLIGYGPSRTALRKRMAEQIAKIFRGAVPGELPIEQPTVFEFALNLKIAKSLDLTVPPGLITRADETIE
jgi:putative ABC transport system substrate-binding protein